MRWVGVALLVSSGCLASGGVGGNTDTAELGETDTPAATDGLTTAPGGSDSTPPTTTTSATGTEGDPSGPTMGEVSSDSTTPTADDSSGDPPDAACQNGTMDEGEQCDDGNDVNGDGCNRDCRDSATLFWETTASGGFGFVDQGFAVAPESDGSMIVAGYVADAADRRVGWMRRYDPNGGEVWNTSMSGPGPSNNEIRGLVSDRSGNIFAAGYQSGPDGEGLNAWIQKLDLDGNVEWTGTYNGPDSSTDVFDVVTLDASGNAIAAGYSVSTGSGNDVFLRKYAPDGAVLWTRTRIGPNGGTDLVWDVEVSPAGNIFAAGYEAGPMGEGVNAWLAKFDGDGNEVWSRSFNGPASLDDFLNGLAVIGNDDVVTCGYEGVEAYPWDTVVRRYDSLGALVWTDTYAGATLEGSHCFGIKADVDNNLVIVGGELANTVRSVFVRKYTPDGAVLWTTLVPSEGAGPDYGRDVAIGPDDTIVVVGARNFDAGVDDRDVWVGLLTP